MHCFRLFWSSNFPLRNQLLFCWVFLYVLLVFCLLQLSINSLPSVNMVFSLWYGVGIFLSSFVSFVFYVLFISAWETIPSVYVDDLVFKRTLIFQYFIYDYISIVLPFYIFPRFHYVPCLLVFLLSSILWQSVSFNFLIKLQSFSIPTSF